MFLAQLWIPILASAVLVFIASSVIHMLIKWHQSEYRGFSNEDAVRSAIRAGNAAPGQYVVPYCRDMKEMAAPEMQAKFVEGPNAFITLRAPGAPNMGRPLMLWFLYIVGIGVITAYVASKTLHADATFWQVCRVASVLPFIAYCGGSVQMGIWMGKPWASVARDILDGFIYGAITGLTFAWLWH